MQKVPNTLFLYIATGKRTFRSTTHFANTDILKRADITYLLVSRVFYKSFNRMGISI